jgi:hypothetical protein
MLVAGLRKAKELLEMKKSIVYGVAKASCGICNRKCKAKEKKLSEAIGKQKSSEAIELFRIELQDLRKGSAADSIERGFSLMNRKIHGAKEFLTLVQDKDAKRKKLEAMNEGIFLLMQSVRTQAGNFNKQHGPMELTASRSLTSMEKHQAIYDTALEAFSDAPDSNAKMRRHCDLVA